MISAPFLKWLTSVALPATTPQLTTTFAWMGIQSCFLGCGANAAHRSTIFQFFPLVRRGRVGAEFFTYLKGTTPAYEGLVIDIYDGTNHSYAELRLDANARTASIISPTGTHIIATNIFPLILFETFLPVKLVVDMDTDKYVRLMIGPDEFDISAYDLMPVGGTTQKLLTISIFCQGGAAGIISSDVDNFILTQNEP